VIEDSKKVEKIFKALCYSETQKNNIGYIYRKIMSSNESRLTYLNHLFNAIKRNEVNDSCESIFRQNIDFLHEFMNRQNNEEISVPYKYFKDKEDCLIVPTYDELEYLFDLLEANKDMYERFYQNKKFILELPNKTFHQHMTRILEIHDHNLAHLTGLTESEYEPDPNKNILKKYFLNNIHDYDYYGEEDSEKLWNWVLSSEGKEELRRLHRITIDFINKDKVKFPNNYDYNGQIKQNSLKKFKERFKEANGFDYPIIKFSRCITKCINNLNFLNLTNTSEVILDYNAPVGKKNEKDIFIVNASQKLMLKDLNNYLEQRKNIIILIAQHTFSDDLKSVTDKILDTIGLNVNDKDISYFINILQSSKYLEGISPNLNITLEKINNVLNEYFDSSVHLIGFDTEFGEDIIPLNKSSINNSHCDTSISITPVELVSDYYHRGRAFFLDKIYAKDQLELLRLSNPVEEIESLERMTILGLEELSKKENLEKKLSLFNKKYESYKNSMDNQKRR